MKKPALLLIASLFLLVSVLYVRAIPIIEIDKSLSSYITTIDNLVLFANFSDSGVGFNANNSCELCIAEDGDCNVEWSTVNVTTNYSADYLSGNCSYPWNISNADQHFYNISFRINNTASTTAVSSKRITLDRLPPIISNINRPVNNSAFSVDNSNISNNISKELTFAYSITDASPLANCSLIFNNKVNKTDYFSIIMNWIEIKINISTTIESIQYYNWSIACTDAAGFESITGTRRFTLIVIGNFSGETTDFTQVNMSRIENLTFEQVDSGKIKFAEAVSLDGVSDISKYIKISSNRIEINSSAIPSLNKSSTLYLYNLTYNTTPKILKDGIECPDTICKIVNYSDGTLIFNVTQFSTYTTQEAPASSGDSSGGSSGSSSGGGSSGGGGGGSGGGGSGISYVCNMDWQCSEWSDCIDGLQTRQCNFVKVPQHSQETPCPEESKPLITSKKCEVKEEESITEAKNAKIEPQVAAQTTQTSGLTLKNESLNQIARRGATQLLSKLKTREFVAGTTLLVIFGFGVIFWYKLIFKKKS
ncbi:hypothetical protein HYT53_02440 [Candidatus Woesearchaeota archaeon]|nr:hypothetical protein [Candidatus Woesearchaeota archaeon]